MKILSTEETKRKSRLMSIAGDDTRLRILCFLFESKEPCVGEIAEALDMSIQSISFHLQIMKDNGFFETYRDGNKVCYKLVKHPFISELKKLVCDVDPL